MEPVSIENGLNLGHASHEGMSGKHNEDYFGLFAWRWEERLDQGLNKPSSQPGDVHLGVVADGVGGQIAGEVASRMAVEAIQDYFDRQERIEDVSAHLEKAILSANQAVYEASQQDAAYRGMSTTVAVVALAGDRLYTAHVGDSRIYLLRNSELRQLSVDHTWAQEAIEAGLITREQARSHPNRNVIRRHLGGGPEVEVDHRLVLEPGQTDAAALANQGTALRPGDTLLICSDGLTDMISEGAVSESLYEHFDDLALAAQDLVDRANQAGGRDNITVVIMQAPGGGALSSSAVATAVSQPAPPATATKEAEGRNLVRLMLAGSIVILLALAIAIALFLVFGGIFL